MAHYYLDSSALVKRYVREAGTVWMQQLCHSGAGNIIYTARISGAEIVAALFLRARTGSIATASAQAATVQFKTDFQSAYQLVEVTAPVVDHAMRLVEKHGLRGYDSIQLAATFALQTVRASLALSAITFVCADEQLNRAASAEGLVVGNPNNHP